jgi:LmbE family N-acetylglucosaminyl deacetylase
MIRRTIPAPLALLLLVLALGLGRAVFLSAGVGGVPGAAPAPSPLQPATTGGLATVDRALAKLSTHRRLLVVGAHPDDEDTSLLTLVARGQGGEAAYLSLSRGEGGQNLIGSELGVGLGLIRTRELLAAREIDGGRQFFTRAFDFGFTRSLDETLRLWPKEAILEDAVRVVRRFKPQVVVAVFPGTAQAGHGQHQEAGVLAPEAYRLAGDPAAFPALLAEKEGLVAWKPLAFYRGAWFDRKAATMNLPLGGIDPLTGKSAYQLAMASRSMHRSQDMGRLQELGGPETRLAWVDGGAGKDGKDIFAGIDTHLAAIAAPLPEGDRKRDVAAHLAQAEAAARKARAALSPERLADAATPLAEILKHLQAALALLKGEKGEALAVADLVEEKIAVAETGLAAAAGVAVDAAVNRETVTPGGTVEVETTLWNGGTATLGGVAVALVADWGDARPRSTGEAASLAESLAAGEKKDHKMSLPVPAGTPLTLPYFLRRPLQGDLYDWSESAPSERGEPFGPPPLTARFTFTFDGVPVTLDREVVYRRQDEALGEVRRPLRVVPKVEVATPDPLVMWPLPAGKPRRIDVTLTSHSAEPESGRLVVQPSAAWPAQASFPFQLAPGAATKIEVPLTANAALAPGRYSLTLTAELDSGERSAVAVPLIEYPHIRPTPRPVPATVVVSATDLRLPPLKRVGYVRGASDRVPEFLSQIGVPLVLLGPADLSDGDLSAYDAIVVGSRAYETDPALGRANGRLLDYARKGGLVLVQYQQYPYIEGHYAPFALDIARPHDRVTDETAAVKLLDPASPVFTTPNRLGPADWEGWVQERGLYFAHTWATEWKPLLAMADPGDPDLQGGLLVAPVGQGHYVYTGLALFRQLPAGVPGAYRLFANLLALGGKGRPR